MTILRISEKEYNEARAQYMTAHSLWQFHKCPRTFYDLKHGLMRQGGNASAFPFGRAFHCLVLEGEDEFEKRYEVTNGPINEKTGKPYGSDTKAYAEWVAARSGDREAISSADYELMQKMGWGILDNKHAVKLLRVGAPELTVRWELCGIKMQSRLDWLCGDAIVDLKTCKSLEDFVESAKKYGYFFQAAVYQLAMRAETGRDHSYYIIASEKEEPHRCGVFRVNADANIYACASKYLEMAGSEARAAWRHNYELQVLDEAAT